MERLLTKIKELIKNTEDCCCDGSPDGKYACTIHEIEALIKSYEWKEERKRKDAEATCESCNAKTGSLSFSVCVECCEHGFDPDEGFHCLNCGKDGSEEVLSALYDRAKDLRKYGE